MPPSDYKHQKCWSKVEILGKTFCAKIVILEKKNFSEQIPQIFRKLNFCFKNANFFFSKNAIPMKNQPFWFLGVKQNKMYTYAGQSKIQQKHKKLHVYMGR